LFRSMYANDNNDKLVPNYPYTVLDAQGQALNDPSWCPGDSRYGNPDGTNVSYLIGNHSGSLGPYLRTPHIFKCPSDRSVTTLAEGQKYPRVRSYSMNAWMGFKDANWSGGTPFVRISDLRASARPRFAVFIDEHEDYLHTCIFWMSWDKYNGRETWADLPSSRHNGAGTLSYSDGAVEAHRWREAQTRQPVQGIFLGGTVAVTASADWQYMWERMTKRRDGEP